MSGIFGWIAGDAALEAAGATAQEMINGLSAKGGAFQKTSIDRQFALGIRTDSQCAHWHESDDLTVALQGYPNWADPSVQSLARERGHAFAAAQRFLNRGHEFLDELHGPFSIAILDKANRRALLAIDRFGVEPLCFARLTSGQIVFGTTADAVRAHPGVGATIEAQTIYNYLYFIDKICAPATIYKEQQKLLPGQFLLYENGSARLQQYWQMPYGSLGSQDEASLQEELLDVLRAALRRSISDEEDASIGAFLSGGLDSSTVTSLLAEVSGQSPKAFTIGFRDQAYDETPFAVTAAKHAGATHDIFNLGADHMLESIVKIARAYDEPFANSSVVPTYFCALRAQELGIDLMLAGDGGDELFAGNSRYLDDMVYQKYQRIPSVARTLVLEPLIPRLPLREKISLFRRANNYVRRARQSIPARLTSSNVFEQVNYHQAFEPDVAAALDPLAPQKFVEDIYFGTANATDLQRMMSVDLRITLADSDLRKVRKACELAGVRVRFPFLDDQLGAFAAKIPSDWLCKNGEIRSFYKAAVRPILAKETINKSKHGFGLPTFEHIDRSAKLQALLCDSLSGLKARRIFSASWLDHVISNVRHGQSGLNCGVAWDIAMLEIWLQSRGPVSIGQETPKRENLQIPA